MTSLNLKEILNINLYFVRVYYAYKYIICKLLKKKKSPSRLDSCYFFAKALLKLKRKCYVKGK